MRELKLPLEQQNSLLKGLEQNPIKLAHYDRVIKEYLEQDFIQEVVEPHAQGHYMPHHSVLKESDTTPLRTVFNASAKT